MSYFLLFFAVLSVAAEAGISDGPDYTLLWNRFSAVAVIDSFVVGIAPNAVIVSRYDDTLELFVTINQVRGDFVPVLIKEQDTLLVIRTTDDRLVFYSLNDLPTLTYTGSFDPGVSFADFAVTGQDIYLSRWFDGIWRFVRKGFESFVFADSSMIGVMMTELELHNDTLYALDRYNGIMRFDVWGPGFGEFIDYLWIPFQATSFVNTESSVVISTIDMGVRLGEFGWPGSGIVDSIDGVSNPLSIFVSDTLFVFLGDRTVDVVNRTNLSQRMSFSLGNDLIGGDIVVLDNEEHLLLPHIGSGLTLYNLADGGQPREGLYRPGPITGLAVHDGKLFTGGRANPIDVYSLDTSTAPRFEYTMFDDLRNVKAVGHNGDTLIVYYATLNKIAIITNSSDPDSFVIETSFFVQDTSVADIHLVPHKIDTVLPLLAIGVNNIDVYAITDSSGIYHAATWEFVGRIEAALVYDSLLFVGTNKNLLWINRINDSLEIEPLSAIDFEETPDEIMIIDEHLAVFDGDKMVVYDYTDPVFPVLERSITLALPVSDAVRHGDKLYTVGELGVAVYNLIGFQPDLVENGGSGDSFMDVDGHILATSDGGSIHVYHLPIDEQPPNQEPEAPQAVFALRQNYPNPFNTVTTIGYSVAARSQIRIAVYNLLGQQVRTLFEGPRQPGEFITHWDGRDHSGHEVASGVYFYRITSDDFADCKKMIYLK
ncbi:MAG: T9SS type A sorting domain-containing protein [Candidatus Zixiibacteriota bacterium]